MVSVVGCSLSEKPFVPWNKGKKLGQKRPFAEEQVSTLVRMFSERKMWRDRAMLVAGTDSMLRVSDLRTLRVDQLRRKMGGVRDIVRVGQQKKKGKPVSFALTIPTQVILNDWLDRLPAERVYVFQGYQNEPLTRGQIGKRVKLWAEMLGLDPSDYSTHSLRRTKPVILWELYHDLEMLKLLLGHDRLSSTSYYLGADINEALATAMKTELFKVDPALYEDHQI